MTKWHIIALLLIALVILSIRFGVISRLTERCPACRRRRLRCVLIIHSTVTIDREPGPDSWEYYLCKSCGAHYKRHLGREFEIPSAEEWAQYCAPKLSEKP